MMFVFFFIARLAVAPLEVVSVELWLFAVDFVVLLFFVLTWFLYTLVAFEFQVAEPVFIGLDVESFAAALVEFTLKHLVFSEFTFERTVVEDDACGRTETYLHETFFVVAENPCIVAYE